MLRYALYTRKSQEDEGRQQQSIEDQTRIMLEIAGKSGLDLHLTLKEEKSAKEPYQRPIFDRLMAQVNDGEIDAILCYHVNRLARNMVEGGLLQHLLTKGKLKEIRTYNEVFRTGDNILPFVLQTAMSTQYSLDLSQTVRRGMSSKLDKGWAPRCAPQGYINNLFEHTIEKDPGRFELVQMAWNEMLTWNYSIRRLAQKMNTEWGYLTRKAHKIGGNPMSTSTLQGILTNIFYTGFFMHKGELYQGSHEPMVTLEQFEAVQKFLRRHGHTRARRHEFAYTGLVVCGHCGRQVTAETKRGQHKSGLYTYYHCANPQCRSKAIRQERLEEEIEHYIDRVKIHPSFQPLCIDVILRKFVEESTKEHTQFEQVHRAIEEAQRQLSNLIKMSAKEMISEEEFTAERLELRERINELKKQAKQHESKLDHARDGCLEVVSFVTSAVHTFAKGSLEHKRQVARKLGVTYRLTNGQIETELHPLLAPLYNGPIEPGSASSGSTKRTDDFSSVQLGWTQESLLEPFETIWNLLLEGAPRLFVQKPEWRRRSACSAEVAA